MNETASDTSAADDAKEEALLRLVRARDARDAEIQAATEAADAKFWALVTEEIDRRPKVIKQREAAAAIGYHRDTIRRHAQHVRARHARADGVTHPSARQGEAADAPGTGE